MKKVEAVIAPAMLDSVRDSLVAQGVEGLSLSEVMVHDHEPHYAGHYRGTPYTIDFGPKVKLEIVVGDEDAMATASAIVDAANADRVGEGQVLIVPVEDAVRVRTGEHGLGAVRSYVEPRVERRWAAQR